MTKEVLFNVPNCIGYVRILLLILSSVQDRHDYFLTFVALSALLDMFDGMVARYLKQESAFGEWLDVTIDLFTRGYLWNLSIYRFGFLIFGFEFLVFVATHASGRGWQQKKPAAPLHWIAARTVEKGFKNSFGFIAISGLWITPFWFYLGTYNLQSFTCHTYPLTLFSYTVITNCVTIILIFCRCFCCFVEACFIHSHLLMLLKES